MFRWFEGLIDPFRPAPETKPPDGLVAFYWHYIRQVWPFFAIGLVTALIAAAIEISLFAFLGQIVDLIRTAGDPQTFFADHGWKLIGMAVVALLLRPLVFGMHGLLLNQAIIPSVTNMIRWQTHRYVLRQSLGFFQNDFAGRIANRIMQTGPSLRESVVQLIDALWFMVIYVATAAFMFMQIDARLMLPVLLFALGFIATAVLFVPRIKQRSTRMSEMRSWMSGRIVDSYTNILTVKLFAHGEREDAYAREAIAAHTERFQDSLRLVTMLRVIVFALGGALIVATMALGLWLWTHGNITLGGLTFASALIIRINQMATWIMWVITSVFESMGTVQEGMLTISRPHTLVDRTDAVPLKIERGAIRYEHIRFHYGKGAGVIDDLSLAIRPGEKVGLVGRSGAGKSTLVHLLLRFYDLEGGRILIDGQDIAAVTQESLRGQIGLVTQDTSLLHRSVLDNIRYGRPEASEEAAMDAARLAAAHDFVQGLRDPRGRTGYDAHVGERGVKLSGGQRQRIAIARVLLKNAPILILDEATSSLDSEVEAAIQEQLYNLMAGKTVIAIAHRLSTIAAMDRLVVMDQGAIVEEGDHASLLRQGGLYAELWARQSGGFLAREPALEPAAE